jgi:ParB-like chromosome segregation protein Spo0J
MEYEPRKTEFIRTWAIEVGNRHVRRTDEDVEKLAASMSSIGMRTPITVRIAESADSNGEMVPILVTGHTRLLAAKKLGFDQIECFVIEDGDEIDAEMWEIAENLHRSDLPALDRSEQISRWIELELKQQARATGDVVSGHFDRKPQGGRPEEGVAKAARALNIKGRSDEAKRSNARRAVRVASLTDEAKLVARELGLDSSQKVLLHAASLKTQGQQIAYLKNEFNAREQNNKDKANRDQIAAENLRRNQGLEARKAEAEGQIAELLADYVPKELWDSLRANLNTAGCVRIVRAFENIVLSDDETSEAA